MSPIRATARITSRGEKLEERGGDSLVTFPPLLHRHMFMAQFSCVSFYCSSEYFNEHFEVEDEARDLSLVREPLHRARERAKQAVGSCLCAR